MRTLEMWLLAVCMILVVATTAEALIRKDFTPLDVVKQSDLIARLKLTAKADSLIVQVKVEATHKGKAPVETMTIDLSTVAVKEIGENVRDLILREGTLLGLLFVGNMSEGEGGGGESGDPMGAGGEFPVEPAGEATALLHAGGIWVRLIAAGDGKWDMDKVDDHLQGTWAGGTDMLERAVRYILADSDAGVPVDTNIGNQRCGWAQTIKVGTIGGGVSSVRVIRLTGEGDPILFVASDAGDRLFAYDSDSTAMTDLTAARGLKSRSQIAAWGDFNGDGRLDLASWDGAALAFHLQGADGKITAGPQMATDCVGLSVIGSPAGGRAAVLVSTATIPHRVFLTKAGAVRAKPLVAGEFSGGALGKAGQCLVGDLDGDGIGDVLQPFAGSSLLYRGKADASFAAAAASTVALGKGRSAACLGDFDADGRLDVFTVCADRQGKRIFQSAGGGKFIEQSELTGELAYIAKSGGIACQTGDINNDGRQDVLIVYDDIQPLLFFNRGFRSFGHSHALDLAEKQLLSDIPEPKRGQQAACIGDIDGDGAQDLAVVLKNGHLRVFLRFVMSRTAMVARVGLPLGKRIVGPVTVTGKLEHRGLGAWNVIAGESDAFFGLIEPDTLTLEWRGSDGKLNTREVDVEEEPVSVTLPAD